MQQMIVINQEVKFHLISQTLIIIQDQFPFISMTPFNLIASLLNLRTLVLSQTDINLVLKCIDSISNEVSHYCQIQNELSSLRSQAKKMKTKAKRLQKKMCLCSKQRDSLAEQLEKTKHVHNSKLQKITQLMSYIHKDEGTSKKPQKTIKSAKVCLAVQCQIITQSQIIELNENQKKFLTKLQILQQKYEDLDQQNKAKDIYISQLLLALESSPINDIESDDEKSNDDSTLDDNSEKSQEQQIHENQLAGVQERTQNSWFQSLYGKSIKLYSFIFN